jgi:hypothetical protein
MGAARPAGHDTLDPVTLSFEAPERNARKPFEFWCWDARVVPRVVENFIDFFGDKFSDWFPDFWTTAAERYY